MIEYLSTSKGSKNTLVIPTVASKPACDVSVRELLDTDWFLICLWIIKLESDVSRFDIFFLGNFEKIPEFSRFKTLGTLILNVDVVVLFVATVEPWHTPPTLVVAAKVNVFPFADIPVTLLKIGTGVPSWLTAITESVLIPTLPAKLLFALVAAVPTTFITSDAEKYGNIRSYNTVSVSYTHLTLPTKA